MNIFVIMPFKPDMKWIYSDVIKAPLERQGYKVSRADDPKDDGTVHQDIYDDIMENLWYADYIIADLTENNPNVFYELGIAHTLDKRTIRISQQLDIPFDIKWHTVISYRANEERAGELARTILGIIHRSEKGDYKFSNIVSKYLSTQSKRIVAVSIGDSVDKFIEQYTSSLRLDSSSYRELATTAINQASSQIRRCTSEIERIGSRTRSIAMDTLNLLASNPSYDARERRKQEVVKEYGAELTGFAVRMEPLLRTLNRAWIDLDQALSSYLLAVQREGSVKSNDIAKLIVEMKNMQHKVPPTRAVVKEMANAITSSAGGLVGLEDPIAAANQSASQLVSELDLSYAVLERQIILARLVSSS